MFELDSPLVLMGSCALMGLCVSILVLRVGGELQARRNMLSLTVPGAQKKPARSERTGLLRIADPLLPLFTAIGRVIGLAPLRTALSERYSRAGYPGNLDDDELVGLALIIGVALALPVLLLLTALEPRIAPIGLLFIAAGPGILSANYNSQGTRRELEIRRGLPFVLDLLVLTMRAGSSFQQAIEQVSIDYAAHPLGHEFLGVLTDLRTGSTTADAFRKMQERVPIESVQTFVDDLVQGEELGRPLAEIFERQADIARVRRVQEATATAGQASVTVLIPGMLVFAAVLILLFAPFFVRWYYGGFVPIGS